MYRLKLLLRCCERGIWLTFLLVLSDIIIIGCVLAQLIWIINHCFIKCNLAASTVGPYDDVIQHGSLIPANTGTLTETCSLGLQHTSLILDIHVYMVNWHLSKQGICWPVSPDHNAGSRLEIIKVICFLKADHNPSTDFSTGLQALASLTCFNQDLIVQKPVHTSQNVNWNINFSSIKIFLTAYALTV